MLFLNKVMFLFSFILFLTSFSFLFKSIFISINIPLMSLFYCQMQISFILDWFSILFLSTVIFISSIIMKFSTIYIPKNQHFLFKNLLSMFILSMSILILSNNIFFILLGWDMLGLSSYILVIFYQNSSSSASGSITILSNRIGDIMILMSISILYSISNWNFSMNEMFPKITLMFLLIAAMSKSAQFPFSAWLPAAMAAPTPISALVHSSTLVTAGVFLMIRLMNFYHPSIMNILMMISLFTVIYASMAALWEQDMKKIIALSTLSQMAMMMFAISINSINSAYFHLISHALFKSMMFLCAGIIIHNFTYQDMRHMGSSYLSTPIIFSMLGIANLSLMGIPFLSGFFSKDMIVEKLINSYLVKIITIMMIFSISLTSMYSMRMIIFSSKFILKSKPDLTLNWSNHMENSILWMAILPISIGLMMTWMFLPTQNFILPFSFKMSIMSSLFIGLMMAFMLSFKKKNYLNLGENAISLWFTHFLSSVLSLPSNYSSNKFYNNDKSWQEMYGPKYSFSLIYNQSKYPDLFSISSLSILMMIFLIPMII